MDGFLLLLLARERLSSRGLSTQGQHPPPPPPPPRSLARRWYTIFGVRVDRDVGELCADAQSKGFADRVHIVNR